jgi:hypothetical protein
MSMRQELEAIIDWLKDAIDQDEDEIVRRGMEAFPWLGAEIAAATVEIVEALRGAREKGRRRRESKAGPAVAVA